MNYIIVGGYISTGSSVVSDILKEYNSFFVPEIEYKVFRESNGILDLEEQLCGDWDWSKSNLAISNFLKMCKDFTSGISVPYSYDKYINPDFLKISKEFIDRIVEFEYIAGSSYYNFFDERNTKQRVKDKLTGKSPNLQIRTGYFSDINYDEFRKNVKWYTDRVFEIYEEKGYETVILDHTFSPHSANRINDYFDDIKMIIVDRDPRDTALQLAKMERGIGADISANMQADKYVKWFLKVREKKHEAENILYTRYEDLIFNYDVERKRILDFVGIQGEADNQFKYFNPEISCKYVGWWKDEYAKNRDFFDTIEKLLPEYCYNKD